MDIESYAATEAQIAAMTAVVESRHIGDFDVSAHYLGYAMVTSNGWAAASIMAQHSANVGDERPGRTNNKTVIFRAIDNKWSLVSYGSSALKGAAFEGVGIPMPVLRALGID